ncbi:MAG TPA: protein kinase [Trebonia sp.]|jgi:serine/threonine-protein kinase
MSAWTVPSYAEDWVVPGFTEERELGSGSSGKVVQAVNDVSGQQVAIKYLSPSLVRDPAFMWGFRAEAQMLRELGVPQVVQVYDYVEQPGQGAAIVMELVNGVSLHAMIERRGPTGPEAALAVLKGSLLGLAAAHTLGIVHRDYKPENVLVDTAGNSKLADFGVAVRWGKQAPAAGTPLYMAPEQWHGAPASPATDVYAATAVFFECLTGRPPFAGKLQQLQEQHVTASVPLDRIDPPLQALIARGMAKNPAGRPNSAIAFVAELEAAAASAYGPDWEERGHGHLAVRAAALLPLLLRSGHPGASGRSYASTWEGGGRKRRMLTVASVATVAVLALAAVAVAAVKMNHQTVSSSSQAAALTPSFKAVADVTPPVSASKCATTTAFAYSGTLSATAPGTVKYQWVYSAGKPGPVQAASFPGPGRQTVTGETVKSKQAGSGWGEIKLLSPNAGTSDKATYKLLCSGSAGGITPVASVQVPTSNVACGTTTPTLTATGTITAAKAETVTYYWAQSDGADSAPATLTFTGPETLAAEPLTITPPGDPGTGEAVLVVTSPVAAASSPATYTLTCTTPKAALAATAAVSPASQSLTSCTAAAAAVTFTGTVSDNKAGTVSYHWKLPSGAGATQTLDFTQAGSKTVTTTYKPTSDSVSGSGSLVVTSPGSATSNAAAFTVACGQQLTVTNNAPATATLGTAYSGTVTVTGGQGTYTWAAVSGLPAGLKATASGATLTISGTPTAAGAATLALSVHDSASPEGTGTASITLTVSAPDMTMATNAAATAKVGTAYSGTATVTGGNGTYKWATTTGLPTGLTATASAGTLTISGTPTAAGTFTVGLSASDTETTAKTATASLTITVAAATPPVVVTSTEIATGTVGTAYTATLTATGGTGTYTWTATGLPGGLAISSAGVISGTPTGSGSFTISATATSGTSTTTSVSIVINPAVIASASPTPTPTISATVPASPLPSPTTVIL